MDIEEYLKSSPKLAQLCSQNGWIDNETLRYELMEKGSDQAVINVTFDEVIMEGSGCVADRISCYGKMRLTLGDRGQVENSEII
ncbi:hypothetical protein [Nitrosococcus wardiae]|uniref:Uncharacterized protein n=1 Tax=Nitrosococcus wardiae TaxID=1814290 RepID=A0A4P7C0Q3_9GAMM|nr:hypothetical protein [Nitrosococcus wardiae]QBQ56021.1 hypothetical protein E3U44_17025 [Nitrosococcus wardiae]